MLSVRPSPLFKSSKTKTTENDGRYWRDCGSGRVDHWWHLSCDHYFHTWCLYVRLKISPKTKIPSENSDSYLQNYRSGWVDHWWYMSCKNIFLYICRYRSSYAPVKSLLLYPHNEIVKVQGENLEDERKIVREEIQKWRKSEFVWTKESRQGKRNIIALFQ